MSDLISRQAALNELQHALWGKEWDEALAKAIIESLPTIDPVKRGKWISTWEKGSYTCSECRSIMDTPKDVPPNYCPNCGAQLEGGEDEQTH